MQLSAPATRVIGALVEKSLETPQSYPLSLNALRSATNQTTKRDPVVRYDEADLREALSELAELGLVKTVYTGSRTPKSAHLLDEYLELDTGGVAIMAVLMLRGPQTLGELRSRTERMHSFGSLEDVQAKLEDLAGHMLMPLVAEVPRQPGQKEGRWCQLLGDEAAHESAGSVPGPVAPAAPQLPPPEATLPPAVPNSADEVAQLREEVAELRDELETLAFEVERLRRALD